eukprot:scaffold4361_cov74-Cyclotella_meneghiniana.AAC.7
MMCMTPPTRCQPHIRFASQPQQQSAIRSAQPFTIHSSLHMSMISLARLNLRDMLLHHPPSNLRS